MLDKAVTIVDKSSGATVSNPLSGAISLAEPSVIKLPFGTGQVASFQQVNNNLLIELKTGEFITIENFFNTLSEDERNELVLVDEDGISWLAQYESPWTDFAFAEVTEVAEADDGSNAWLLGLLGLAGAAALISSNGGGGGGGGGASSQADTNAPSFISAESSSDGTSVVLTYDETLDAANPPVVGDFVVTVDGVAVAVTAVAINGDEATLTLANPIEDGEVVTVSYSDPTAGDDANAIQDMAGNDAADIVAEAVTNNVPDTTAPTLVSAESSLDGTSVVLTYDETLDAANPPVVGDFVVTVDGVPVAVTAVAINGDEATLTLANPIENGEVVTVSYSDPTAGDDANAIQDLAGNDAADIVAEAVTNNVPDTTAPTFVSAESSLDGTSVVLTYDETLDAANPPVVGDFVVTVDGVAVAVTAVAINGDEATLTLANPIENGEVVTVGYSDPTAGDDANAIQDLAGNDAADIVAEAVTNNVPDTTAPTFVSAESSLDGTSVVLTYDETLDAANPPVVGDFVVTVDGVAVAVTAVAINGDEATLTLANPIENGEVVTVDYTDPTAGNDANAIQDVAGNDAADIVAEAVTNNVPDTTAPTLVSAESSLDGTSVVLTYDETLDAANPPVVGDFVVTVDGVAVAVTAVAINGDEATLTLANPIANGEVVTVSYADPTVANDVNAIQDVAGNDALSIVAEAVANNVPDTTAPILVSAESSGDGASIVLAYDETLDAANPPVAGDFAVTADGVPVAVTAVAINGNAVTLTLAAPILNGEVVAVDYTDPTAGDDANATQDLAGNDAADIVGEAVTNNVGDITAPTLVSAESSLDGTSVVLTYDETLDAVNPPVVGDFVVTVDGVAVAVTAVAINGDEATLTLANPIENGEVVTVDYTDPTAGDDANAIQDMAGNDAADIVAEAVTNNVSDTTAPTFVSAESSLDGTSVVLTYDETLDAANPPVVGDFVVTVDGVAVAVTAVAINGDEATLTLANPIENGEVVTVGYSDPTAGDDANAIQDLAGNDAADIVAEAVTNNVPDTTAPTLVSAESSLDGTSVVLTYDETLDAANPPVVGDFVVTVDGVAVAVTAVAINGDEATLTLANPIENGEVVTVGYSDPTAGNDANAIQDVAGNDAADIVAEAVTNNVPDTTAPTLVSAESSLDGTSVVLTYDETLDAANPPVVGDFVVTVDGVAVAVTAVAINGDEATLTLANPIENGEVVTVDYTDPTAGNDANAIQDVAGNDAADIVAEAVTNNVPDTTAPTLISAETSLDGTSVVLTYDETLDAANPPVVGDFVVTVDGVAVAVTAVAINGDEATLTLANPIANGEVVTVSYADPTVANDVNAIQDVAGNDALSIVAEAVANTILPPTLSIPEAAGDISAVELNDGIQATVGLTSATQAGDTITITANDGTTDFITTYSVTAGDVVAGEAEITLTGSAAFADGDYTASAFITNAGGSDTNATNTVAFAIDAVNDAPEVQAIPTSLLGLVGVEALNLIDLKDQDLAVFDRNGNLESVVIEFSSLLNLSLGAVTLSASTDLADELGLQFNVVNNPGLLNILASSSTMTITANGGGTIDNQIINEFLASVLFNEGPVSLGVLEATTITATDTDGASTSDSAASLASVGVLNTNVSVIEATIGDDVQNGTAGSDRIYGYDGNDTLSGGDGDDLIRGGDGDDILSGGDGNDLLIDGNGNDTLLGGDGNDLLVISDDVFAALDGGSGYDILQLDGGFSLDLTGVVNISNIEQIDLGTGDSGSTLTLTEAAVSSLTDVANELYISGEANDTVNLLGAEFMGTTSTDVSGVVYDNYSFGVNQVSIDQDIQVFI